MKNSKKLRVPALTATLFGLSAILLVTSSVGGARAALNDSKEYKAHLAMKEIGVALCENGNEIAEGGELLTGLVGEGESFVLGKDYDEVLTVKNNGSIDEYVRVVLTKYWKGEDGKQVTLSPELIDLQVVEGNGWVVDDKFSGTDAKDTYRETITMYYTSPVGVGASTPALTSSISVDGKLAAYATQERVGNTIVTTYDYDGIQMVLEAEVDGVQTHHADDAIYSAWGREVSLSGDTISLK